MSDDWPAPEDPSCRDVRQLRRSRDGQRLVLRRVRLWGAWVLVEEDRRVWCPACLELVPVEELGRPDNRHAVGLLPRVGALLPMRDDDDVPDGGFPSW